MWYHNCGHVNLSSSWMSTTPAFRGFFTLHFSRLEQSPHYDSCQLSGFVADLLWSPMTLVMKLFLGGQPRLLWSPMTLVMKLFLGCLLSQKQSSLSWYIIVPSWIAGLRLPPHCGCTTKLCVTSNYNPGKNKNKNDIVCGRNSIRNAQKNPTPFKTLCFGILLLIFKDTSTCSLISSTSSWDCSKLFTSINKR